MNTPMTSDPTDFITTEQNILKDKKYAHLRNEGFVRGPTVIAQWLILVNSAWSASLLPPLPEVKAYLVHMLARTMGLADLASYRVGYLFYAQGITDTRMDPLIRQQMADVSLVLRGLFPDTLNYRHSMLTRERVVEIGQTLYHQLWLSAGDKVYDLLANEYMRVVMVLEHMRPQSVEPRVHALDEFGPAVVFPRQGESAQMLADAKGLGALLRTTSTRM